MKRRSLRSKGVCSRVARFLFITLVFKKNITFVKFRENGTSLVSFAIIVGSLLCVFCLISMSYNPAAPPNPLKQNFSILKPYCWNVQHGCSPLVTPCREGRIEVRYLASFVSELL